MIRFALAAVLFATPALADCNADFATADQMQQRASHSEAISARLKALHDRAAKLGIMKEKDCQEMLKAVQSLADKT